MSNIVTYSNASIFLLQDANNNIISVNSKHDQLLSNLLLGNNFTINTIESIKVGGINQLSTAPLFTDSGINSDVKVTLQLNKLSMLPSPSGYSPVIWSVSDKNLNVGDKSSVYNDITVNANKLNDKSLIGSFVILFAVDPSSSIVKNIYKLYKIKNQQSYNLDQTTEKNYLSTNVACNSTDIQCNANAVGKLRYVIYDTSGSKVVSTGYISSEFLINSNVKFVDINNKPYTGIIIIEGSITLPSTNEYSFSCIHDCGIEISIDNKIIIANKGTNTDFNNKLSISETIVNNYLPYNFKIKLTIGDNQTGTIALKYRNAFAPLFEFVSISWFSTKYFMNVSDSLNNIYNKQREYCINNLNQQWCKNLTTASKTINDELYDGYCLTNNNFVSDYTFCNKQYNTNDKLTSVVNKYCTDMSRLFNPRCLSNNSIEPEYISSNMWEARVKHCDATKFKTDPNCIELLKEANNLYLFDKILYDNCKPGDTSIPCKTLVNTFNTNKLAIPIYSNNTINDNCIKSDGTLNVDNKFCLDTVLTKDSPYSAQLIKPMVEYCKTGNNVTAAPCLAFVKSQEGNCNPMKSTFTNVREDQSYYYNSTFMILLIFIFISIATLIQLNFKIDCIYYNKNNH